MESKEFVSEEENLELARKIIRIFNDEKNTLKFIDNSLIEGKRPPVGINEALVFLEAKKRQLSKNLENSKVSKVSEESKESKNSKIKSSILDYATSKNTDDIIRLHNIVYDGYYPYTEMLDKNFVSNLLSSRKKSKVALFRPINDEIYCGCAITSIDITKKIGYMRGLMMDPAYRGKIDIKNLLSDAIRIFYMEYKGLINRVYTECRTTHSIAQFMMNYVGLTPVAILPSKDIFFGPNSTRETDALMVIHYNESIENRSFYHALLPEFAGLYNYMEETFKLESKPDFFKIKYKFTIQDVSNAYAIYKQIFEFRNSMEYNKTDYNLFTPNGSKLSFTVTKTVNSAEDSTLSAINPVEMMALVMKLEEVFVRDGIKYFELYLPAINPEYQRLMLEMGFDVFGYIPAWHENQHGLYEDVIVFGKTKEKVRKRDIKLIGSASLLLRRLKPFMRNSIY